MRRAKQIRANKWKNSTTKDELITEEEDHTLSFSELIGFSEEEEKMMTTLEKIEKAKGRRPKEPMRRHYAQTELLIGPFKRYTFAM